MQRPRIRRDYRHLKNSPTRFLAFIQNVKRSLSSNFSDTTWGTNATLVLQFFSDVDAFEKVFHLASDGGHSQIRERDRLSEALVVTLDQIVSMLEGMFVLHPDALLITGFEVVRERKISAKAKAVLVAPENFNVINSSERNKALATASNCPGALNHEIHINLKDPSVEEDWMHKGIYPDAEDMLLDNLAPGNTYFRMRHHGKSGAGPWSAIVSVLIT